MDISSLSCPLIEFPAEGIGPVDLHCQHCSAQELAQSKLQYTSDKQKMESNMALSQTPSTTHTWRTSSSQDSGAISVVWVFGHSQPHAVLIIFSSSHVHFIGKPPPFSFLWETEKQPETLGNGLTRGQVSQVGNFLQEILCKNKQAPLWSEKAPKTLPTWKDMAL